MIEIAKLEKSENAILNLLDQIDWDSTFSLGKTSQGRRDLYRRATLKILERLEAQVIASLAQTRRKLMEE